MADDQERAAAAAAAADEDMADASSDGSSSDSDFEEIELSPEDAKLLMKLEQQLAANPNLYDSHVQVSARRRRCQPKECILACVFACQATCLPSKASLYVALCLLRALHVPA